MVSGCLGSGSCRVHSVLIPVNNVVITRVLDVGRRIWSIEDSLVVGFVFREKQSRSAFHVEESMTEVRVRKPDHTNIAIAILVKLRARRMASPGPGVAKPYRGQNMKCCRLGTAIVDGDLSENIFDSCLRILD